MERSLRARFRTVTLTAALLFLTSMTLPPIARGQSNDADAIWNCVQTPPPERTCSQARKMFDSVTADPSLLAAIRRSISAATEGSHCRERPVNESAARRMLTTLLSGAGLGSVAWTEAGLRFWTQQVIAAEAISATDMMSQNMAACILDARVGSAPENFRLLRPAHAISRFVARAAPTLLVADLVLATTNESLGGSLDQAFALDPVRMLQSSSATEVCRQWSRYPHVRRGVEIAWLAFSAASQQRKLERQNQACAQLNRTSSNRMTPNTTASDSMTPIPPPPPLTNGTTSTPLR